MERGDDDPVAGPEPLSLFVYVCVCSRNAVPGTVVERTLDGGSAFPRKKSLVSLLKGFCAERVFTVCTCV